MAKATGMVLIENNQAITTSLKVAKIFEKDHKHVLEAIENLIEQMASNQESRKLGSVKMFQKSSYKVEGQMRNYPMYLMNKDGFTLLAMGFTGAKALQFKLDFIQAFNQMEQILRNRQDPKWQQIRRAGIDFGRKPCMEQIHKFNERDFEAGDKDPRGKARYGRYTHRTQIAHAGIPAGGRDSASGVQLAAQLVGEYASATEFARGLVNNATYNPTENKAVKAFKGIYDLMFNNEYLDNPPTPQLLTA